MKINVIGGGPAGLYFAILMKKADAAHQIRIYERNGPDDTFGWGVVFSGKTLANLRAALKIKLFPAARSSKNMRIDTLYIACLNPPLPTFCNSIKHAS